MTQQNPASSVTQPAASTPDQTEQSSPAGRPWCASSIREYFNGAINSRPCANRAMHGSRHCARHTPKYLRDEIKAAR